MKKPLLTLFSLLFVGQVVMAQSLAPATSEDLNEFDQQLNEAQSAQKDLVGKENKPANFGSAVSAEARTLKDADSSEKKGMGDWVREQKGNEGLGKAEKKARRDGDSEDRDARRARERSEGRRK